MTEPTLDGLIRSVQAESDDVLVQLESASQKARELEEIGDALLNHFVDRCRRAGHTWAQIGDHLGVTRQAAQKRFVDSGGDGVTLDHFTPRAREAVDQAGQVASGFNHNYVGTEHQLLALFDVGGVGARALSDLGITRAAVEREVTARAQKGDEPTTGPHPLTPRGRKVLVEAAAVGLELGHNYVGTEHLLLGLLRDQDGIARQVLETLGVEPEPTKAKVVELLEGYKKPTGSS